MYENIYYLVPIYKGYSFLSNNKKTIYIFLIVEYLDQIFIKNHFRSLGLKYFLYRKHK